MAGRLTAGFFDGFIIKCSVYMLDIYPVGVYNPAAQEVEN